MAVNRSDINQLERIKEARAKMLNFARDLNLERLSLEEELGVPINCSDFRMPSFSGKKGESVFNFLREFETMADKLEFDDYEMAMVIGDCFPTRSRVKIWFQNQTQTDPAYFESYSALKKKLAERWRKTFIERVELLESLKLKKGQDPMDFLDECELVNGKVFEGFDDELVTRGEFRLDQAALKFVRGVNPEVRAVIAERQCRTIEELEEAIRIAQARLNARKNMNKWALRN